MNGTRADHFVAQDNTGPVPPTPEFSATPTSGLAPLTVQFTDQSSGSIDSWSWNFGDNTPDSDVQSPAHTYLLPGQYTVSLTVMGPGGTSTRTRSAYIEARPSPGDLDGDNDVDLDDFGRLQRCLTGPGSAQTSPSCRFTDLDGDLDVDRYDVNLFIGCMSGAGIAADPSCLGNR
jgi:PKD repeat protein